MTNDKKVQLTAMENSNMCLVRLPLDERKHEAGGAAHTRPVENVRNCDIFVEDFHVLIYADVRLLKHKTLQQLDTKDMKNIIIKYDTQERCYELQLPCMPQTAAQHAQLQLQAEKAELVQKTPDDKHACGSLDLWKLKRITDHCQLQLDNSPELLSCVGSFDYGFASKYKGRIRSEDSDLSSVCRMPEPNLNSPLQRSIDREIDELKNFSRDQYKLNFVELQIPEGHDDPMKFVLNLTDSQLSRDEGCVLHNLTSKSEDMRLPDTYDQTEIDCGLISLLLAICYDVRTTSNESTCESAWTRSILSALLSYFEPCDSIKEVVNSFLRRALIYPLYRNYELGRLCVQDAIDALQRSRSWILKQLLFTHELFLTSDCSREVFNRYYIADYIRYVSSETLCPTTHLEMLAHNLKNVLLDVYKKHLRLGLCEIETELLKELITDIHIGATNSEDESEADDDNDESEGSTSSESEQNSVIEQQPLSAPETL